VPVVHAMLGNAAIAALLAPIVLVIGYASRSSAVRHAAWLIVLLKLVTPPLLIVPLAVLPASWGAALDEWRTTHELLPSATGFDKCRSPDESVALSSAFWSSFRPMGIADWAIVIWVIGAIVWFVWQGRRIYHFRRRVANAENAPPEVAAATSRIATALGITRPPEVKIATGIASPMLWGRGGDAVVLFPRELLTRLSSEARDTLLAHELAHFLRRDHWVRVLEYVVTGLYWWHPAVWLARRGIEAAEEECCDAWVVGGLSASARKYAEALLETVNFEAELRRPRLPPGACAANRSARLLHSRLVQIIHAKPPSKSRGGPLFWILLAVALTTQPVLRAVTSERSSEASPAAPPAALTKAPRPRQPTPTRPQPKIIEPRVWAMASPPGSTLTVLARDYENGFILRHSDGASYALGPGQPLALSFAPGIQRIATAGPGTLVRTWDYQGHLLAEAHVPAAARAIAYVPDGTRLLVLDSVGGISIRDSQTLAVIGGWSIQGPANSIACNPDGRTIAVSFGSWLAETGWVECWSIAEQRKLASYSASAPVGACRFSTDGRILVIGGWNGQVTWCGLPGGEVIAERQLSKDLVANTAFCPDAGTLPLQPPPLPSPQTIPEWVQKSGQLP
jgi:bla regulator protein BlaR1